MALNFQVRAVALSFPVLGTASKSSLWSPREHVATATTEVIHYFRIISHLLPGWKLPKRSL